MESDLFSLEGRVALVTGSTRGIGKAIAEALARAGARVSLSSRKSDACEAARAELAAKGYEVMAQPCNVSRKDELQALVDATRARWGGIDIVVSNAAANPYFGPLAGDSGRGLRQDPDEQRKERALARRHDARRDGGEGGAEASSS